MYQYKANSLENWLLCKTNLIESHYDPRTYFRRWVKAHEDSRLQSLINWQMTCRIWKKQKVERRNKQAGSSRVMAYFGCDTVPAGKESIVHGRSFNSFTDIRMPARILYPQKPY